ncbi:MAG: SHOCT domain-containing protein [Ruminococcus sp.]
MEEINVIVIVILVVLGIVYGAISRGIYKSKGYSAGFWWGFFFGLIGIFIVICIPKKEKMINYDSNNNNCDFIDDDYDESEEIKKFKQLLDNGLITEEEFSAKKKQILGI